MPSPWTPEADRDLLMCIIDGGELKNVTWANISAKMSLKGYGFTLESCRQHFQKLRKQSLAQVNGNLATTGVNMPGVNLPPTPKRRAPRVSKVAKTTANISTENPGEDDDEGFYENFPQPPEKRHRGGSSDIKAIKDEEVKESGGDRPAYMFKTENNGIIDLENDDIYEV